MFKVILFFLSIGFLLGALFIVGYYNWYIKPSDLAKPKLFIVNRGESLSKIANHLERKKIIKYSALFRLTAMLTGEGKRLRAGEYAVSPHSSPKQILDLLVSGKFYEHSFSVPEGVTVYQVVQRLKNQPALIGDLDKQLPLEGSIQATTVKYLLGTHRKVILNKLLEGQKRLIDKVWQNRDKETILKSKNELVTLASIIEKETADPSERTLIASVFYNRLAKNIRLQSDPTVIYGIYGGKGRPKDAPIHKSDLENENPYNTYKNFGLPPSPIAIPGEASLQAAAHPAKTDYLYFVASKHLGQHIFSKSLNQHNIAVHQLRKSEKNNIIADTRQKNNRTNKSKGRK